jgi:hypothetical protein
MHSIGVDNYEHDTGGDVSKNLGYQITSQDLEIYFNQDD